MNTFLFKFLSLVTASFSFQFLPCSQDIAIAQNKETTDKTQVSEQVSANMCEEASSPLINAFCQSETMAVDGSSCVLFGDEIRAVIALQLPPPGIPSTAPGYAQLWGNTLDRYRNACSGQ